MIITIIIDIFALIGWVVVGFGIIKLISDSAAQHHLNLWFDRIFEYDDSTPFDAALLLIYAASMSCLWPLIALYWGIIYLAHRLFRT